MTVESMDCNNSGKVVLEIWKVRRTLDLIFAYSINVVPGLSGASKCWSEFN